MSTWMPSMLGVPAELAEQPWQLVFQLQPPTWALVLIGVACVAMASWSYIGLRGEPHRRLMLACLRALSTALLATLMLQPAIEWPRERRESDIVLVLADRSRSLAVTDERGDGSNRISRDRRLCEMLNDPVWSGIRTNHQVRWFGFAGSATTIIDPAKPPAASGERTLIGASLQESLRSLEGQLVGSIVILSDGRSQDAPDPELVKSFRREGTPVFVVPLGDPDGASDRSILEVEHPQKAFPRDRIPVQVSVSAASDQPVQLVLRDRATGRVLDRGTATAAPDGRLRVTLTGESRESGDVAWEVALDPQGADADPSNDRRPIDIKAVDHPIRVLYLDGRPRWEFRYLRSILLREAGIESAIMLLSADRDFAQEGTTPIARLPSTVEEFAPFDVIVLGDVPAGALDANRQKIIREQVARRGTGLVWIGGERSTPISWEGFAMEDLLPFKGSLELPRWDEPVLMQPTQEAFRLGLLALGDSGSAWPGELGPSGEPWARLEWAQRLEADRLKPTVEPWAVASCVKADGTVRATQEPLVVSMRYGAGTVVYVATDETWRWRHGRGETLQERFWVPIIRHLARLGQRSDSGTVSLSAEPSSCAVRQPVRLTVDGAGRILVDEVVVEARRQDGVETREIRLRPEGDGRFSATWAPDRDGAWTLRIAQPRVDGTTSTTLQVRSEDAEARDTRPDHTLLSALAEASGGAVIRPDDLASLKDRLPDRSITIRQPVRMPLWDRWPLYALLALLLVSEWLGRRALQLS